MPPKFAIQRPLMFVRQREEILPVETTRAFRQARVQPIKEVRRGDDEAVIERYVSLCFG